MTGLISLPDGDTSSFVKGQKTYFWVEKMNHEKMCQVRFTIT